MFGFLPDALENGVVKVASLFVGEGWHLTLGLVFMLVVIFLPGGVMEGARRLGGFVWRTQAAQPDRVARRRLADAPGPGE